MKKVNFIVIAASTCYRLHTRTKSVTQHKNALITNARTRSHKETYIDIHVHKKGERFPLRDAKLILYIKWKLEILMRRCQNSIKGNN